MILCSVKVASVCDVYTKFTKFYTYVNSRFQQRTFDFNHLRENANGLHDAYQEPVGAIAASGRDLEARRDRFDGRETVGHTQQDHKSTLFAAHASSKFCFDRDCRVPHAKIID